MNRSKTNNLSIKDFKGNSNEAFGILYSSYFVYTKRFVLNNKGSVEDEDIFMKNKGIEEIQSKYNYSTKKNAQNQKYKCVEQIKRIKEKSNIYA
ncbi:MAG: hypothetical protein H7195_01945 [Chryseobacterium sp.]|nr:hypothetical protein [Chryseobacterium sp.]